MAYLSNPPKDSLLYAINQKVDIAEYYVKLLNALKNEPNLEETIDTLYKTGTCTISALLWLLTVQAYSSRSVSKKEYVMGSDVCSILYSSKMENIPYEELSTDSAITYIDISAAGLDVIDIQPNNSRVKVKICGGVILNMRLIDSRLKRSIQMLDAITSHDARTALESGYILMLIYERLAAYTTLFIPLGHKDNLQHTISSLIGVQMFSNNPDEQIQASMMNKGIALDMIVKSVLFLKYGNFEEQEMSFGPRLSSLQGKEGNKKQATPKQGGLYRVSYIKEQTGGHGIPWLPTLESTEIVDEAIDELNAQKIEDHIQGLKDYSQRIIPDHFKRIWVTEEYIDRHRIPSENIIDSGDVPRRGTTGNIITKKRFLIAKEFVYGHDFSKSELETDVVRVGLKKAPKPLTNPYDE